MTAAKVSEQTRRTLQRIQNAVNPADPEGRTPLHRAAEKGSYLGTHRLLQEGADPNITDKAGRTPLHSCGELHRWERSG